jgi:hypothetical protein
MDQIVINKNSWHAKLWKQSAAANRYGNETDSCTYVQWVLLVMLKWLMISMVVGAMSVAAFTGWVSMVMAVDAAIHMIVAGMSPVAAIHSLFGLNPSGTFLQFATNVDTWVVFGVVWWVVIAMFAIVVAIVILLRMVVGLHHSMRDKVTFSDLASSKYLKKMCIRVKIGDPS